MGSLSATPTANVFISAFSPPVVNGADVHVSCNVGKTELRGTAVLMHDLALGIIRSIRAARIPIRVKNAYPADRQSRPGGYLGPKLPRVAADDAKYKAMIAEIDAQAKPLPFGFISQLCRRENIEPTRFYTWRNNRAKAKSAKAEEAIT